MNLPRFVFASCLCIAVSAISPLQAQSNSTATNTPPRRAPRAAPLVSPDLLPGGGVAFRLKAPQAKEVKVVGQFGSDTPLQKDDQGVWSVTLPSVPPGVHEYRFVVDGLSVIDPQNPAIKPQRWPNTSILHVPSVPAAPWDLQDIPHGVLHEHLYHSKVLGTWRKVVVYTPPGAGSGSKLPVLYLSHGYSDNEGSWSVHGKAHWILDSLIAQKKAVPMIVVMPDGHALPPAAGAWEAYATNNSGAYCEELVKDIVPLVESHYRVASRPRSRAFAGLSMGGHHAFTVALKHHDQFGWVGAFSAATPVESWIARDLEKGNEMNRHLKLFWIACGKKDFLFQNNETFSALLKTKGIQHEYLVTEGDHSWPVWRRYLVDFAPKLFR
ncbi:MAG: hypothetical protein JNN07_01765 [Verrucomicrobiales bacterium]|nr:hypothetical protein [Verrucomicrobiales bacterium]